MENKTKLGIVFSGGGGKGAYEMGVWKALKEFGIDKGVQAVAGTSVGGLNGALFVQGDYPKGEQLWKTISRDKIMMIDYKNVFKKILGWCDKTGLYKKIAKKTIVEFFPVLNLVNWYSQEGLLQLIRESGVCGAVKKSDIPFHVCALNGNTLSLEFPKLNCLPEQEIEKWLQATAAIPGIFSAVEINGEYYHDGGVLPVLSNNTPYKPLIEQHGCTHIIAIFLDNAPLLRKSQSFYPKTRFWNIVPSNKFKGGVSAPLDFTAKNAIELIERGYADAKQILLQFREFQQNEEGGLKAATQITVGGVQQKKMLAKNEEIRQGDLLTMENPAFELEVLEADIDSRELDLINSQLDNFMDCYSDNSQSMQEAMFEGLATLASTEGRIKHAMTRGILGRVWEGLTGKSSQLTAEIEWDLNRAIHFNQSLITKMAERNSLTLEAVSALQSRLTYVMSHSNYLTAASKCQKAAIEGLAKGVVILQGRIREHLQQVDARLTRVEMRTDLQMWLLSLPTEVEMLPIPQRVLHAALGFYHQTDGEWRQDEFMALQGQLTLLLQDGACTLSELSGASEVMKLRLEAERFCPVLEEMALVHPAYAAVHPATPEALDVLQAKGLNCGVEIPAVQLTAELLCSMSLFDTQKRSLFPIYNKNAAVLAKVCREQGLAELLPSLENWQKEMRDYRLLVPLIGKFSSGKSTLLNAFLGQELLGVDIGPETADASELCYAEQEETRVIYLDGSEQSCQGAGGMLLATTDIPVWFYRRFIDNRRLQSLGKLVPVDMPGFDSDRLNHEKAVANYLERGDLFLAVLSSDAPFDETVMERLREIHQIGKEFHLVLTKCGRQPKGKLQEIRVQLAEFFAGVSPQPEILCVESRGVDADISAFTGFLLRSSVRFDEFFQARYEPLAKEFIHQIRMRLEQDLKLSSCDDLELKAHMAAEQKTFQKLAEMLRKESQEFRQQLSEDVVEQVCSIALRALHGAEAAMLDALKSNTLQQTITGLIRPVVQAEVRRLTEDAIMQLGRRLQNAVEPLANEPTWDIAVLPPQLKEGSPGTLEATIAGVIGGIVAGPIGVIVGAMLGKVFFNNEARVREENQTLIRSQVVPQVVDKVRSQLQMSLGQMAENITRQIETYLQQQRDALEEKRKTFLVEMKEKQSTFQQRKQQLQQAIDLVSSMDINKTTHMSLEQKEGQPYVYTESGQPVAAGH